MTEPTTTSFTLELRGFPGALDHATLAGDVARVFGLAEDDALALIGSAPVVVKRHAPADAARAIARSLVALGAEVIVRNEASGEAKVHRPTSTGARPAFGARRNTPAPAASERVGAAGSVRPPLAASTVTRTPAPIPAPDSGNVCGACARPVDRGENCPSCGWHDGDLARYCPKCRRRMLVGADTLARRGLLVAWGVLTLAGAAATFYALGLLHALAAATALVAPLGIRDGRAAALRCPPCGSRLEAGALHRVERTLIAAYKRRRYLASSLLVLIAVALATPSFATTPDLHVDSFGVGWTASLPATHRDIEKLVLTMSGDGGPLRLVARRASNPRLPVQTLLIMLVSLPERDARPIEHPSYDRWLGRALDTAVGGAPSIEKSHIVTSPLGPGREAKFEATVEGKPVSGRLRAFVNEQNLVMVAFVARGEGGADDPTGISFLESLALVTDGAERTRVVPAPSGAVAPVAN